MKRWLLSAACAAALTVSGCNTPSDAQRTAAGPSAPQASADGAGRPFSVQEFGGFSEPWAMTFLPDGRLLVSEKPGTLRVVDPSSGRMGSVSGLPAVDHGGQGGLGDVVLHPGFASNRLLYISYAEAGENDTRGAAVARGRLDCAQPDACTLSGLEVVWRQVPKVGGRGHYGHRIAFDADGKLWISSGERQKFDPAQDMSANLGKIVRLNDDGSVPSDNPFADQGGVAAQVWSLGHRNPLGLAFDAQGRLWNHEMGPKGGDELNLVERGANYGYPIVSNGDHYDGRTIPDHDTRPEFRAPAITWNPVISPAGFIIYSGTLFDGWRGDGFIGGLSSKSLVRIEFDGKQAREAERWDMGARIREVEQGPDGAIWLLEDERDGSQGRLLKLVPANG
ncbi:PQQ-dependent sugar dehydrogenase [Luteimonas vadosa]|uniref:PQQ-dependent sugar dehydrogenase n=1 Tax=Luteimonas vadosa TaxID=1165507 RepID=A0ABP9DSJ8_9GAMM